MRRRVGRIAKLAALVLLAPGLAAQGDDLALESQRGRWRLGYDFVQLEDAEDLGLVGLHYDRFGIFPAWAPLYLGVGGYTAVDGDSGGLFLGGVTLGAAWTLFPNWILDAGAFVGAGGGIAAAPDGWAVRPFVALERGLGPIGLRAEVAALDMDDVDNDLYASFGLTLSSEQLEARATRLERAIPEESRVAHRLRVTPRLLTMVPDSDARRRSGAPLDGDVRMLGLGVDAFLNEWFFLPLEAYGAVGGDVDGFAAVLGGLGVSVPIVGEHVRLEAKGTIGGGGGGDVDTGGGLAWQALGGLRAGLAGGFALEAMIGRTSFPDGALDATTWTAGLSWSGRPVELAYDYPRGNLEREGLSGDDARPMETRFAVLGKVYVPDDDATDENGQPLADALSLIGFGFEQPLGPLLAATGKAFAAADGGIGGYAEGLLGAKLRFRSNDFPRHEISALAEVGAAGGGGMDVGSGLLYHFTGGWRYALSRAAFLTVEIGRAQADRGSFSATSYTFGLGLDLHRAFAR